MFIAKKVQQIFDHKNRIMTNSIFVQTENGSLELQQQIIPARFVWHVSNSFFQKKLVQKLPGITLSLARNPWYVKSYFEQADQTRRSISENGLMCSENSAVFANQHLFDVLKMHPIWLDHAMGDIYNPVKSEMGWLSLYDFWLIDTHSLDAKWYVDHFMEGDIKDGHVTDVEMNNYICTKSHIPVSALTLFRFDVNIFQKKKTMYNTNSCLMKEKQLQDIWDSIQPDVMINRTMRIHQFAA